MTQITIPSRNELSRLWECKKSDGNVSVVFERMARGTVVVPIQCGADERQTSIVVRAGARAHVVIVAEGTASDAVIEHRAILDEGSSLHWHILTLLTGTLAQNLRTELRGACAASTVDWIFFANDHDRYDLSARNVFLGRDGGGDIVMKGIAQGHGHVSAKGMIEIGPKASGTHTYLTQDVLMLDPQAEVDAIPGLEIKTNDVKASHSATVARVTPEDLFTFAARGIPQEAARRLYVQGFLADLLARVPEKALRMKLEEALDQKFPCIPK